MRSCKSKLLSHSHVNYSFGTRLILQISKYIRATSLAGHAIELSIITRVNVLSILRISGGIKISSAIKYYRDNEKKIESIDRWIDEHLVDYSATVIRENFLTKVALTFFASGKIQTSTRTCEISSCGYRASSRFEPR